MTVSANARFICGALIAALAACGGKVVPDDSTMGGGSASTGSSVAGSLGISTGQQAGVSAGSDAADHGSGGTTLADPGRTTATCGEAPASMWWPPTCPADSRYGLFVPSPGDATSEEALPSTCTCAGCAPGIAANYDQCTGWNVSLSACSGPRRCAALGLSFDYGKDLGSNGDFTPSGGTYVDTSDFSWQLDSVVLRDHLGDFGGPDGSSLGRVLSFEVTALAVDPGRARPSWKLRADVRACVAGFSACAK